MKSWRFSGVFRGYLNGDIGQKWIKDCSTYNITLLTFTWSKLTVQKGDEYIGNQ